MHIPLAIFIGMLCFCQVAEMGFTARQAACETQYIMTAGPERRAVRRSARRTTRRTMRRWAVGTSLAALPAAADCSRVVVNGRRYWHCDDTYFDEVVRDGATVYVVVDP